ncbi:MAG: hypothetical protein WCO56_23040 [Verrucomicrobiota bacterium]
MTKLRAFARCLDAYILRPYYPVSNFYRVVHDERGLQVDFMGAVHGIRSFERLRSGAETIHIGGYPLALAALRDIIDSKRTAGRNRDQAVLEILEHTLHEKEKCQGGPIASAKKGK